MTQPTSSSAESKCSEVNESLGLRCDREVDHEPSCHWQQDPSSLHVWGFELPARLTTYPGGSHV